MYCGALSSSTKTLHCHQPGSKHGGLDLTSWRFRTSPPGVARTVHQVSSPRRPPVFAPWHVFHPSVGSTSWSAPRSPGSLGSAVRWQEGISLAFIMAPGMESWCCQVWPELLPCPVLLHLGEGGVAALLWWCPWSCPSPCLLYTSPSPRDRTRSRMPSSA